MCKQLFVEYTTKKWLKSEKQPGNSPVFNDS